MSGASPPAGRARLEVVVRGRVQGVGFRYFVLQAATRLALDGWVANERDGSVRVVAQGDRVDLDRLTERLSVGPPGAHVSDLAVRWAEPLEERRGFSVRGGSHSGD